MGWTLSLLLWWLAVRLEQTGHGQFGVRHLTSEHLSATCGTGLNWTGTEIYLSLYSLINIHYIQLCLCLSFSFSLFPGEY